MSRPPHTLCAKNPNATYGLDPTGHETINLRKALLGLERVRSEVNISMLPRPPSFHRGVYVFDSIGGGGPEDEEPGSSGVGDGYLTGDPLPEAWMEIGRYGVTRGQQRKRDDRTCTWKVVRLRDTSRVGILNFCDACCGNRLT